MEIPLKFINKLWENLKIMSVKFTFSNLTLILFIGIISTVTITENLQTADGLLTASAKLNYELNGGDTQMLTWKIINNEDVPIYVEFYAEGEGSELLVFEEFASIEPRKQKVLEVFVVVPETVDDVEYHPTLFVIQKGTIEPGKSGFIINVRLQTPVTIKIGDNPIYTPPTIVESEEVVEEIIEEIIKEEPKIEEEILETIEEKLARIKAANEANKPDVIPPTEKEPMVEKTPKMDPEPTFNPEPTPQCGKGSELVDGYCQLIKTEEQPDGGGCLIATAAFGSEMSPQVQLLREIRDNQLMNTDSGISFMAGFNQFYYSFSPYIADMQRENPVFKEAVKIGIIPLLSSLSIMQYAESDSEVLGLGISVIILNIGMYMGIPIFGIVKLYQFRKN